MLMSDVRITLVTFWSGNLIATDQLESTATRRVCVYLHSVHSLTRVSMSLTTYSIADGTSTRQSHSVCLTSQLSADRIDGLLYVCLTSQHSADQTDRFSQRMFDVTVQRRSNWQIIIRMFDVTAQRRSNRQILTAYVWRHSSAPIKPTDSHSVCLTSQLGADQIDSFHSVCLTSQLIADQIDRFSQRMFDVTVQRRSNWQILIRMFDVTARRRSNWQFSQRMFDITAHRRSNRQILTVCLTSQLSADQTDKQILTAEVWRHSSSPIKLTNRRGVCWIYSLLRQQNQANGNKNNPISTNILDPSNCAHRHWTRNSLGVAEVLKTRTISKS